MDNNLSTKLNTVENNVTIMKTNWGLTEADSIETLTEVAQQPSFQSKSVTISENGTINVVADEGYSGLSNVEITSGIKYTPTNFTCQDLQYATNLDYEVGNVDISNVTRLYKTFNNCVKITSLDLSNWNTSKVTTMEFMFYNCTNLATLNISNFDISNVTSVNYMFNKCSSLTELDLRHFNISKLTNLYAMFDGCSSLTSLNLSTWDTSKVVTMYRTFAGCSKLTYLDIRNFNFSAVKTYTSIFNGIPVDCLIIVKDDTAKNWVLNKRNDLTNVKTVVEYEAA